jgi:hypothetical protein
MDFYYYKGKCYGNCPGQYFPKNTAIPTNKTSSPISTIPLDTSYPTSYPTSTIPLDTSYPTSYPTNTPNYTPYQTTNPILTTYMTQSPTIPPPIITTDLQPTIPS